MVYKATMDDVITVSSLLMEMYIELFPGHALTDLEPYVMEVCGYLVDPRVHIYLDSLNRGLFIVKDETSKLTPTLKRYNGYSVYIKPQFRKTRVLYEFYKKLFSDFPDGDIFGYTELHSEHIKVCDKRHNHILNVYKLNRSI